MHVYIHIHVYIYINSGVPQKYFHVQGGAMFAYNDELNAASAGPVTPLWRILMHNQCSRNKRTLDLPCQVILQPLLVILSKTLQHHL